MLHWIADLKWATHVSCWAPTSSMPCKAVAYSCSWASSSASISLKVLGLLVAAATRRVLGLKRRS
eukprot:15710-Pelagomonas_calceolata.AAC.2